MINYDKKRHYLAVKKLSTLFRRTISEHDYLHVFMHMQQKRNLNNMKMYSRVMKCRIVEMASKDDNILKYNSRKKYMRVRFVTYVDMECLFEKINTCRNNPNESSSS